MTTDQVAPRPPHGEPPYGASALPEPPYGASALPEPVTAPIEGEWTPPAEGWAGVPANGAPPPAPTTTEKWTGKKVIAAVALTAALAGGAGFGIGMAVESGSGSSTQQGGPGGGQFPGGGNGGFPGGGGFGNQQQGSSSQQGNGVTQQGSSSQQGNGATQQGAAQDGSTSTT